MSDNSVLAVTGRVGGVHWTRLLALATVLVALGGSLQVLFHFIDVVGTPSQFLVVVALSLIAATVVALVLRPLPAALLGAALLLVGLAWYLNQLPGDPQWLALLNDALSLFRGQSLLRIANVRIWVLGVTPAPVFLTWYFALRRWYTPAVLVAGATLAFFVLTGDATTVTSLTGITAAVAALGLGDLERRRESLVQAETILVVVALMVVVPSVVSVIPVAASSTDQLADSADADTVESSLLHADESLSVQGDISLSPKVRFTVTSDASTYWRVGSYDRYTGYGWVRTGGHTPYRGGRLPQPDGPTTSVDQTFHVESQSDVMPAAWKPISAHGVSSIQVQSDGGLAPGTSLDGTDTYQVRSRLPSASPRQLQNASTAYPDDIVEDFTQLPDSTPERVTERTSHLTANADNPYQTARVVERWLETHKRYSLDVNRPRGTVADTFLFKMDAGYCTYYATTMATMLRSQDIPARFVVGYSPGERVNEHEWVVRGLNAHAWVEVYFPDYGWVRFDPTPAGPRDEVRQQQVETARKHNDSSVDTTDTKGTEEWTLTATGTPPQTPTTTGSNRSTDNSSVRVPETTAPVRAPRTVRKPTETITATATPADDSDRFVPRLPSRTQLALGVIAFAGALAGVRQTGLSSRAYRAVWLRYQPRVEPEQDVERAFQRLLYYLGREANRPRREHETITEYLDALGCESDVHRVAEIRERTRYRGAVTVAEADEAVRLVDRIVR